jgi:hypothetical protein
MRGICDKCNKRKARYNVKNYDLVTVSVPLHKENGYVEELFSEPYQLCFECVAEEKLTINEYEYEEII